ncbi:MAG: hypothetical protein H6624_04360 [Bdellovibrionaceae bacterium]|nr:hypothetical protein [Bdellovibrionales bacterium]MCB9083549.1 hypothetical protein [Pseudobdellovibrionaceae bacterium]
MEGIRLHNWISRILGLYKNNEVLSPKLTTQRLAAENSLDRRKAARIHYPEHGAVGNLPEIHFEGKPMRIYDISLGGTCLIDDLDYLQSTAGNTITLDLVWKDKVIPQPSLIVAAGFDKRHIRFLDLDTQSYVRLNLLLKPGYLGLRMRKIPMDDAKHLQVGAEEMWVGISGEAITLFPNMEKNLPIGEITLYGHSVLVYADAPPVYKFQSRDGLPGQRIREQLLHDLLIFAVNIKNPSERMMDLIYCLTDAHKEHERRKE